MVNFNFNIVISLFGAQKNELSFRTFEGMG